MKLPRLKKRADFVRVAKTGKFYAARTVVVQVLERCSDEKDSQGNELPSVRVGFTASRKVGNAVKRNRAKRRLAALVSSQLLPLAKHGVDIVLIARYSTVDAPFEVLEKDFNTCLQQLRLKESC